MKKLFFLFISVFIISWASYGQNNDAQIKSIQSKIAKSDKAINNPKKKVKISTWDKRGKIFLDAYELNIKYLAPGIAASTIPFLGLTENNTVPYYGKPQKRYTKEDGTEVWKYDKVEIYVKNGVVDSWKITKPVTDDALIKSYKAFTKAMELDENNKYKNKKSTIKKLGKLRGYLTTEAINYYYDKQYPKALQYIEAALDLFKYPRAEDDTSANIGAYYYYAGIFAYSSGNKDKAKKYLEKAIENNFDVGTCYQYLAQVYYEEGDSATAVAKLEEGAQKYPDEVKIIYSLIDYYSPRNNYDKVFEYLDKAINLTPDNAILYFVKGDAYAKIYLSLQDKYFKNLRTADSLSKAAFRARLDEEKSTEIKAKEEQYRQKANQIKQQMDEYYQKVKQWYDKGFELDPNYLNAYLMLADFYSKAAEKNYLYAQEQPSSKQDIYQKYLNIYQDFLKKELDILKKYDSVKPNDIDILKEMKVIYHKLKMYQEEKQMQERINQLSE